MTANTISSEIDPRYALDDPADRNRSFTRDQMHFPTVLCPLFQSFHPTTFTPGYLTAAGEYAMPIADFQFRYGNNYQYEAVIPIIPASEAEAREQGQRSEAALQQALAQLEQRWYDEHLPRLRELFDRLTVARALDPAAPLDPARLDDLVKIGIEAWTIHFRIVFPALLGAQLFEEFLTDIDGPEVDAHTMLTGVYTESVAAGIGITDLAFAARELGLAELVLKTPPPELDARLRERSTGVELLAMIAAYLDVYGLTQARFDYAEPTWLEDPTPLYGALRSYLETGGDNRAAHENQARRAEVAIEDMREQLLPYPEPVRAQFEALLALGRAGNFLHEEHNFYIDQRTLSSLRLAFLALGRQLAVHGHLDDAEDIFFLHLDEIHALLGGASVDARAIAAERRMSYETAKSEVPPPFLGVPPSGPPPDNPVMRAMSRFFGWMPPASDEPGLLRGYAGSRGETSAPAFVARSLEEASAIPVGHVLVTITTTPSWTPLFGIASAIVTETGGPLSHCAVVAREYGVPAVVGAAGATRRIETGQTIRVDGTNGEVILLS